MKAEDALWFRFGFDVVQFLLTGAVGVYVWLVNRERVSNARLNDMETHIDNRLDEHDRRLTAVEAACGYAPTHTDLGKIYQRMDQISGEMRELNGGFAALRDSVSMIHDHLLNGGR